MVAFSRSFLSLRTAYLCCLYNILEAHTNSEGDTSNLPSMHCICRDHLLAFDPHNLRGTCSEPFASWILQAEALFRLSHICNLCGMSNGSLSQYPTHSIFIKVYENYLHLTEILAILIVFMISSRLFFNTETGDMKRFYEMVVGLKESFSNGNMCKKWIHWNVKKNELTFNQKRKKVVWKNVPSTNSWISLENQHWISYIFRLIRNYFGFAYHLNRNSLNVKSTTLFPFLPRSMFCSCFLWT